MAAFCWDCYPHMFGGHPDQNDLRDETLEPDEAAYSICERCGPGWFDAQGRRVWVKEERRS